MSSPDKSEFQFPPFLSDIDFFSPLGIMEASLPFPGAAVDAVPSIGTIEVVSKPGLRYG